MQLNRNILDSTEEYIFRFFRDNIPAEYVFHDYQHTRSVLDAVIELGNAFNLTDKEIEILQLAAWFHDIGFDKGAENHEERSSYYATEFLHSRGYPEDDVKLVRECINATKYPQQPRNVLQKIICDADMSYLGKKNFSEINDRLRQEIMITKGILMNESEWIEYEIEMITKHRYHTPMAEALYNKRKLKHLKQLKQEQLRLNPSDIMSIDELDDLEANIIHRSSIPLEEKLMKVGQFSAATQAANKEEIQNKQVQIDHSLVFKTTLQTQLSLAQLSDNKAFLMVFLNASFVVFCCLGLFSSFNKTNLYFLLPIFLLLAVSIASMLFAIKALIANNNQANTTKNTSFLSKFKQISLDSFDFGIPEAPKEAAEPKLYDKLSKAIQQQGMLLSQKNFYLSYSYKIFMYGLIVTVFIFSLNFALQ